MKRIKLFLINAMILTGTSLLMRTVGVSFNVYISNKIGASGTGLFSLIMSVYALAVTFATSGISLAATRLVAEELGRNSTLGVRAAMKRCITYSTVFGSMAGIILFLCSTYIGTSWLGDERTVSSLKLLAFSLPFIALSSSMHGYFTAVRRVIKSASAQIFEQFVKIILTIFGLTMLAPKGLEYACIAIVGGASIAELISFLYTFLLYIFDLRRNKRSGEKAKKGLTKEMLGISLPIALSSYVRSGLVTIEHLLIPYGLKRNGASSDKALATYGIIHGMVMPIILFPSAFLSAFSGLLVPELAECRTQKNYIRINYIISRVFQITLTFSIGVAGILMCFSYEVGMAIYNNSDTAYFIKIIAPLIPVMYLDSAVDGILKGLNQQLYSMSVNIIDALLSVILVYTLLPKWGINGYICVVFIAEIINTSMSINRLLTVTDFRANLVTWLAKPIFCIIGSTSFVKIFFSFTKIVFPSMVYGLIIHILMSLFIYILFLKLTWGVTKDDIKWVKSIFK